MKSLIPNPKKISIPEMFNDSKGKTSLSKFMAAIVILVGCFGFVWGTLHFESDVLASSTAFVGAGTILLGIRRYTKDKDLDYIKEESKTDEENTQTH